MSKTPEDIYYTDEELNQQESAIHHLEELRGNTKRFWDKMMIHSNIFKGKRILSDRKCNRNRNAEM